MSVQETGTFSLTEFIEDASRLDEALPLERFSKATPAEKPAENCIMTVTVCAKTRQTNGQVVSVVRYERRLKGFVNTRLLRLVVVPAAKPAGKQFGGTDR